MNNQEIPGTNAAAKSASVDPIVICEVRTHMQYAYQAFSKIDRSQLLKLGLLDQGLELDRHMIRFFMAISETESR